MLDRNLWPEQLGLGANGNVVRGLDQAMLDIMEKCNPPQGGVVPVINLPFEGWGWYSWLQANQVTVTASSSTVVTAWTLPANERYQLLGVQVSRDSGDNGIQALLVHFPTGYFTGVTNRLTLVSLGVADPRAWWPDPSGAQSGNVGYVSPPLDLEPLSVLSLEPSGEGVGSTVFDVVILVRRSKLIRARVPSPA